MISPATRESIVAVSGKISNFKSEIATHEDAIEQIRLKLQEQEDLLDALLKPMVEVPPGPPVMVVNDGEGPTKVDLPSAPSHVIDSLTGLMPAPVDTSKLAECAPAYEAKEVDEDAVPLAPKYRPRKP